MAPKTPQKADEPLIRAYAVIRGPGGWITRTYLVPKDSTLHEDAQPDTLPSAVGRVQRGLAMDSGAL